MLLTLFAVKDALTCREVEMLDCVFVMALWLDGRPGTELSLPSVYRTCTLDSQEHPQECVSTAHRAECISQSAFIHFVLCLCVWAGEAQVLSAMLLARGITDASAPNKGERGKWKYTNTRMKTPSAHLHKCVIILHFQFELLSFFYHSRPSCVFDFWL